MVTAGPAPRRATSSTCSAPTAWSPRCAPTGSQAPPPGAEVVDAGGGLVTEPFVDAHLHLDKVRTLPLIGDAALRGVHGRRHGRLGPRHRPRPRGQAALPRRDPPAARSGRRWPTALRNGVLHVQAFADVDTAAGLIGVQAVLAAREEFRGRVDVSVVAFPQDGVLRDPGAAELVEEALATRGRRRRRHPVDRGDDGRPGGPRRVGVRAGRPAGTAGRDAHRRRPGPRLRHHPHARRGDAPARARGPGRGLPRAGGRPLRRRPPGRAARPRPGGRAGPGQRSAHRLGGAAGGTGAGAGRGRGARPGRHRGRVLPVRPAQPARGRLPRRAPAGHAVRAAAGGAGRPGDDVGRPGARACPATGCARAARPTCSCTTRPGRSTCWPATPRPASSSAPARCSDGPVPGLAASLRAVGGRGPFQSWKTSMAAPISTSRS